MKYFVNAIADRRTVTRLAVTATSRALAMQIAADTLTADNVAFDRLTVANSVPDTTSTSGQVRPAMQTARPSGTVNAYFVRVTTSPTADELKVNPDAAPVVDDGITFADSLSAAYAAIADRLTADNVRARCYLIPDDRTAYAAAVDVVRGVTTTLVKHRCRPMDYRLYVAAHKAVNTIDDADVLDMVGCAAVGIAEGLAAHNDVPAMYDRAYAAVNQYVRAMRGGTSISLEIIRDALTMTRRNVRELLGLTRGDSAADIRAETDALTAPAADAHIDALTDDLIDSDLVARLVACLTPKQTRVLDLYMRGLSVRDICKATGTKSPNAVTKHIHYIRQHAAELIDAPAYADRAATLTAATAAAEKAGKAALNAIVAYSDVARTAAVAAADRAGQAVKIPVAHHPHYTMADQTAAARRTLTAANDAMRQYAAHVSDADRRAVNAAAETSRAADVAARAAALAAIKCRRAADRPRLDARARRHDLDAARLTAVAAADRVAAAARVYAACVHAAVSASEAATAAHNAARVNVNRGRRAAAVAAVNVAHKAATYAAAMTDRARAARRAYAAAVDRMTAAVAALDCVQTAAAVAAAANNGYATNDHLTAAVAANVAARVRRRAAAVVRAMPDIQTAIDARNVARAHAALACDLTGAVQLAAVVRSVSIAHSADARAAARRGYKD